jgi:hypothetical protein
VSGLTTLTVVGAGDDSKFCGLGSDQFTAKIQAWKKLNSKLKTVEVLAGQVTQGIAKLAKLGIAQTYVDRVALFAKKNGLTIKALPTTQVGTNVKVSKDGAARLVLNATPPSYCYLTAKNLQVLTKAIEDLTTEAKKSGNDLGKAGQTLASNQRKLKPDEQKQLTVMSGPLKSLRPILTTVAAKK